MKLLLQSLLILSSFVLIFIWQESPLSNFTLPILGILMIIFLFLSILAARKGRHFSLGGTLGIFLLNTLIVLLVLSTGDMDSPFFFLLYLMVLALVFVFEPYTIIAFCTGVVLLFLPDAIRGDFIGNSVKLGLLLLISPLALYFGREYQKSEAEEIAKHEDVIEEIKKDVEDVLKKEEKLNKSDAEKLSQAVKKAEKLKKDYEERT